MLTHCSGWSFLTEMGRLLEKQFGGRLRAWFSRQHVLALIQSWIFSNIFKYIFSSKIFKHQTSQCTGISSVCRTGKQIQWLGVTD